MNAHPAALLSLIVVLAVSMAAVTLTQAQDSIDRDPQLVYRTWTDFCAQVFTARSEPLYYETFGNELKWLDDGRWSRVSRNSAALGFETNLPARTHVEYGKTPKLGMTTEPSERPFFLHLHHLTGLDPNTQYHYRGVAVDERGQTIHSDVQAFRTTPQGEGQSIPQPGASLPIVISEPGHYVLTQDIVADQTAILVNSGDVTLDLNGHTVTYNARPMVETWGSGNPNRWWDRSPYGVKADGGRSGRQNVRVLNGHIIQGAGSSGGSANQRGCAPVGLANGTSGELAGLILTWHGNQVAGVEFTYGSDNMTIHHNVLRDMGTEIVNRHQAVRALARGGVMHHNLLARARQRGIEANRPGSHIYRNEIYVDSWTTNSFAIAPTTNSRIHDNRIFGGGYLAVGIATFGGTDGVHVHDNFILVQATQPLRRWPEYGPQSGAHGIRVQWGAVNTLVENNVVIGRARDGGRSRTLWVAPSSNVTGVLFRNNTIKSISEDTQTDDVAAISITGENDSVGRHEPMMFLNNRIIANLNNVRAGETYGGGSHGTRFIGNTFVRSEPQRDDYHTLQIGFWTREIYDHQFIDSKFENGASQESFKFVGTAGSRRDFAVGHTITVRTVPQATVTATDRENNEVFSGQADSQGVLDIPLLQYRQSPDGRVTLTPHKLTIDADGRTIQRNVTVDGPKQVQAMP